MATPMTPIFIGIGHKKQSGKDTFAKFLEDELNAFFDGLYAVRDAFAHPLKQLAMECFGLTYEQCYGSDQAKNTPTQVKGMTARQVLQKLGVACREAWPGIWVNAPFMRAYGRKTPFVILSDVRFPDEADAIKSRGGYLVRVDRDQAPGGDTHESELALCWYEDWDQIVNNNKGLNHLRDCATIAAARIVTQNKELLDAWQTKV